MTENMQPPLQQALSDAAAQHFPALFQMLDEYGMLMKDAGKIISKTTLNLLKAQTSEDRVAAKQMAIRELAGRKSEAGFASVIREDQFESLAQLKRGETRALELLLRMDKEVKRLSALGIPEVKMIMDHLVYLGDVTTTPLALEERQKVVCEVFQQAIGDLGIHGRPAEGR